MSNTESDRIAEQEFDALVQTLWEEDLGQGNVYKRASQFELIRLERKASDIMEDDGTHKGQSCPIRGSLCQEGFCIECNIYQKAIGKGVN